MAKDSYYHHHYDFLLLVTLLWCNWYTKKTKKPMVISNVILFFVLKAFSRMGCVDQETQMVENKRRLLFQGIEIAEIQIWVT